MSAPPRPELDAVIAARIHMEQAFWDTLRLLHQQEGVSANEIARRLTAAKIASRPTVLEQLRTTPEAEFTKTINNLKESITSVSGAFVRLNATLDRITPQ